VKGQKTGGRAAGTPNKDKAALLELIQDTIGDSDYHPVVAMAIIANDSTSRKVTVAGKQSRVPKYSLELRAMMHKEVAQYVAPKLKAVEHTAGEELKGLNFYMNFTDEREVSRPDATEQPTNGRGGNGAGRPRPRAGQ
jgi:hypothetical protein